MSDIIWTNEKRRLSDLVPWPRNPRQINQTEGKRLAQSLDEFAQVETIAIGPEDEIYNGHQRLNVWAREHGPDLEVDVRVSSRALTEKEREKLTVYLHRGAVGEWDWDELASWGNETELIEWGFQNWELGIVGESIDREAEWDGMPEFEQEEVREYKVLTVRFLNEGDYQSFAELIGQNLTIKSKSIWYPKQDFDSCNRDLIYDES